MTVKELIEQLQEYDENSEIVLDKGNEIEYEIEIRTRQTLESRENGLQYTVIIY